MFCTHCGHPCADGTAFCVNCGHRLTGQNPAQPSDPAQPAAQAQPVQAQTIPADHTTVWVFRADRKYSMFKRMASYIVFKRDHLILAHLSPETMKAESARIQSEIKAQGLGFFKGSAAMMHHWSVYGQRYDQMPEADILAEDSANLAISYADIQKVFFHAYDTSSSGDSNNTVSGGKFTISLHNGETFQFTHQQHHNSAVRQTLQNLFGNRLKYRY